MITKKTTILSYLERVFRYFTVIYMYKYSIIKLNQTQFEHGKQFYNYTFNELSLQDSFWAFFSLSPHYMFVTGIFEMVGAFLLLFEKTKLIGVMILFPILLNVFLLDFFYEIDLRAFVNVCFYLMALLLTMYVSKNQMVIIFKGITGNQSIKEEIKSYCNKKAMLKFIWIGLGMLITYFLINICIKQSILHIAY